MIDQWSSASRAQRERVIYELHAARERLTAMRNEIVAQSAPDEGAISVLIGVLTGGE